MILFDCESLRRPFYGFYTFADNMAWSLADEARKRNADFGLYLPKSFIGKYGDSISYVEEKSWHKIYLPLQDVDLYHVAHQRSHYRPRMSSVPVLTTIHDLNFLYSENPKHYYRHLKRYQKAVDWSDRIVAISEFAKRDIEDYLDLHGKHVDMIYNGLFRYKGPVTAPDRIPQRKFLFALGNVVRKKNFHTLPCLLQGNDYELIVSGVFKKPDYAIRIMDEARKWGVADRVIVTGPISEPEKYWYLQHCEAFMFPSISEGFGMPMLEAMEYEKPVFISDRTCLPEISGGHAFFFNHGFDRRQMQEEFNKGMDDFYSGRFDIAAMKAHAETFDWRNTARQYFDIYSQMLQR